MHRTSARPAPLNFLPPPTHSTNFHIDRRKDIGLHSLSQLAPYYEAPIRDGLRTPPADDMSTAYQHSQYNISGRQDATYSTPESSGNGYAGEYSSANMQVRPHAALSQPPAPISASDLRREAQVSQPYFPQPQNPQPANKANALIPPEGLPRRKSAGSDIITPNLQIPLSINNSGGSLAEFAAQITCLFWFESTDTLHEAEQLLPSFSPARRLREEVLPSSGFRKWVVTILSTTQVTQNVILLALLFIYRLKTINPTVKGRSGSEYRLLTVALMLGNKFLDDNTYTNKTWAEVSGISVTEIHVMEVEFLSNMRYSLLASKEQWQEWQEKLGKFWVYCDRASKALQSPSPQPASSLHPTLPSPPNSMQASPPSVLSTYPSNSGPFAYNQNWPANNFTAPLVSPLATTPDLNTRHSRKRSLEGDADEPAFKRVTRPASHSTMFSGIPTLRQDVPRLPVPNLTISTTQPYVNTTYSTPTSLSQNIPLLPPLSGRAMSTVYSSTPAWPPQLPMLTPTGPPSQQGSHNANGSGYTTPSRRQSPHSVHDLLSLGSSPISANFPGHNPGHISPSIYLQQRASPYKPVRHVNTLLYPPSSASMHDYSMSTDQMHYQPLGKRHDMRSGIVPDYSHPPYQQWPVLPQPNFHS